MSNTVKSKPPLAVGGQFATTHWSVVMAACSTESPQAAQALEALCRTYWFPLYVYIRRRGHGPEDAQDLTQEFFTRLLEKNWLAGVEPRIARFRSFLVTALDRFLINEYDRSHAAKRGGGKPLLSLDQERAEGRYASEPSTDETPERVFDLRWALTLLDAALTRLRGELSAAGKARQFELLSPFLSREGEAGKYSQIAQGLGLSVGAVRVTVHRLRQRYRELVREEVANTVVDTADVDDELRYLFALLGGKDFP
jgi:RNA polymerase sigma factor (sigma-70 family)